MTLAEEIKQKAQALRDKAAKDIAESDRLLKVAESLANMTEEQQKAIKEYFFPTPPEFARRDMQKDFEEYVRRQQPCMPQPRWMGIDPIVYAVQG